MQLEIRDLSVTYANNVQALRKISLSVPEGLHGLLGPQGAGKSTLLRVLATVQQPDHGSIHLDGVDVLGQPDEIRRTIGHLPQPFGVYPTANAEDLLGHFALLRGMVRHWERREFVEATLRRVGLWDVRRQGLGSYAPGMRLRFGVAVALLGRPRLLLVDEPTAGLDAVERLQLLTLLRELGESRIVLLATRSRKDVDEFCDRVATLDQGSIPLELPFALAR